MRLEGAIPTGWPRRSRPRPSDRDVGGAGPPCVHEGEVELATTTQTALITGAGSGIGRAIASSLDAIGVRVALIGRDPAKLEATRAELSESGRTDALSIACDVADRGAVAAMAERVLATFGAVD